MRGLVSNTSAAARGASSSPNIPEAMMLGRAKANASRPKMAQRSAKSSQCRKRICRRLAVCRCSMKRSAGNSRCLGRGRISKCNTIGTAIVSEPARNATCRKLMVHRAPLVSCAAAGKVFGQRAIELHAGIQPDVIGPDLKAFPAIALAEIVDFRQIVRAKRAGVDLQALVGFRLFKLDHAIERKMGFSFVQDVKQD